MLSTLSSHFLCHNKCCVAETVVLKTGCAQDAAVLSVEVIFVSLKKNKKCVYRDLRNKFSGIRQVMNLCRISASVWKSSDFSGW